MISRLALLSVLLLFASCRFTEVRRAQAPPPPVEKWKPYEVGKASWYGRRLHGSKTASGKRYDQYQFTAAHKKLPFGTMVRVTNLKNGKTCVVKITDRGPFIRGRVIDLSLVAAQETGVYTSGVAGVKLEVLTDVTNTANKRIAPPGSIPKKKAF